MPHGVLYSVGKCDMLKPKEDYVLCYIKTVRTVIEVSMVYKDIGTVL